MFKFIIKFIILFVFSINSFGQIGDPSPNLDSEWFRKPVNSSKKWNFSNKPYKKITTIEDNKIRTVEEFDSIGRSILFTVEWNDFITVDSRKYKDTMLVELSQKRIYKLDEAGVKKGVDTDQTKKINLNEKGKIIEGYTMILTKEGLYKIVSHSFYDKKNRKVKSTDTLGISSTNYYYSKKNLIRMEDVYQKDANNKSIIERIYKYDKNNQIYFAKSSKNKYVNNKLIEKKTYLTVNQTFKNKLLIKKVFIDDSVTNERSYTYDDNKNLINFLETKKNTHDDLVIYQMKTTHIYENNHIVYSENYDGSSSHQYGQYSFSYYIYSENDSLSKTINTYDVKRDKKSEVKYFYNEYNHIIKTNATNSDETVYEIEYF